MDTKICSYCKLDRDINEFSFKNKKTGLRQYTCVKCNVGIRKKQYEKNKSITFKRNLKNKKITRDWYNEYKSTLKCEKCEENHPSCLDFHHTDRNSKKIEVSKMLANTCSKESLLEEIKKCKVLCSNCHRKLHFIERNFTFK